MRTHAVLCPCNQPKRLNIIMLAPEPTLQNISKGSMLAMQRRSAPAVKYYLSSTTICLVDNQCLLTQHRPAQHLAADQQPRTCSSSENRAGRKGVCACK
jgi:hypothetical protein